MTGPLELEPDEPEPRGAVPAPAATDPPATREVPVPADAPVGALELDAPPDPPPDAARLLPPAEDVQAPPAAADLPDLYAPPPESFAPENPASQPADGADATAAVGDADAGASPWRSILLTPLSAGVLPATAVVAGIFFLQSWLEGGADIHAHGYRAWGRGALLVPAFAVIGLWSRRITLATIEDRPVAGFTDERDPFPRRVAVGLFMVCLASALLPAGLWMSFQAFAEPPLWLTSCVLLACTAAATLHLPFAHASTVLRGDASGAMPARSIGVWRRNAWAARIAVAPTAAFFVLLALAALVSGSFAEPPRGGAKIEDHTAGRDALRIVAFVLRFAAAWAALVSARVAGLLARDVSEVREEIR